MLRSLFGICFKSGSIFCFQFFFYFIELIIESNCLCFCFICYCWRSWCSNLCQYFSKDTKTNLGSDKLITISNKYSLRPFFPSSIHSNDWWRESFIYRLQKEPLIKKRSLSEPKSLLCLYQFKLPLVLKIEGRSTYLLWK